MAICHVVTFTFTHGTPDATIAELVAALDDLALTCGASSYRHGPDLGIRAGSADYAVVAVFHDETLLSTYNTSPKHLRIVALLAPHLALRSSVQFALDLLPTAPSAVLNPGAPG